MAAFSPLKHGGCPLSLESFTNCANPNVLLDADGYCLQCKDLGKTVRAAGHPERAQQAAAAAPQDSSSKKYKYEDFGKIKNFTTRSSASSISISGEQRCLLCNTNEHLHKSHIVQIRDIPLVGDQETFDGMLNLLNNWDDTEVWKRKFKASHEMNMILLCQQHSVKFDAHKFSLVVSPLDNTVKFISHHADFNDIVQQANVRMSHMDLSHLSRRGISLRMEKAIESGNASCNDWEAWKDMRNFSLNGSVCSEDNEGSCAEDS